MDDKSKRFKEFFDHLDNLDKNKALFVMMDGSISDPVGLLLNWHLQRMRQMQ